jgi:hypothetical protein
MVEAAPVKVYDASPVDDVCFASAVRASVSHGEQGRPYAIDHSHLWEVRRRWPCEDTAIRNAAKTTVASRVLENCAQGAGRAKAIDGLAVHVTPPPRDPT